MDPFANIPQFIRAQKKNVTLGDVKKAEEDKKNGKSPTPKYIEPERNVTSLVERIDVVQSEGKLLQFLPGIVAVKTATTAEDVHRAMCQFRFEAEDFQSLYNISQRRHCCWENNMKYIIRPNPMLDDFYGCKKCIRTHWCRSSTEPWHCPVRQSNDFSYVCGFSSHIVNSPEATLGSFDAEVASRTLASLPTYQHKHDILHTYTWTHTESAKSYRSHANVLAGHDRLRAQKFKQEANSHDLVNGSNIINGFIKSGGTGRQSKKRKRMTNADLPEMTDEMAAQLALNPARKFKKKKEAEVERDTMTDRIQRVHDDAYQICDQDDMDVGESRNTTGEQEGETEHIPIIYSLEEQERDRGFITRYFEPLAELLDNSVGYLCTDAAIKKQYQLARNMAPPPSRKPTITTTTTKQLPFNMSKAYNNDKQSATNTTIKPTITNADIQAADIISISPPRVIDITLLRLVCKATAQMVKMLSIIYERTMPDEPVHLPLEVRKEYYGILARNLVTILSHLHGSPIIESAQDVYRYVTIFMFDVFTRTVHDQDSFGTPILIWAADPWLKSCIEANVMNLFIEVLVNADDVYTTRSHAKTMRKATRLNIKIHEDASINRLAGYVQTPRRRSHSSSSDDNDINLHEDEELQETMATLTTAFKQEILFAWNNITHQGNCVRTLLRRSSLRPMALFSAMFQNTPM